MARNKLTPLEESIRKEITDNILTLLSKHNLSQAELSRRTGIPKTTISGYVKATSIPNKTNLKKIASAFNVEIGEIDPRYGRNYNFVELKRELVEELNEVKNDSATVDFLELAKKANSVGLTLSQTNTDRGNNMTVLSSDIREYNYFDTAVSAGIPNSIEAFDEDHIEQVAIPDLAMGKYAGCTDIFFTKINGDSMNNIIPNQSLIAVKKIDTFVDLKDNEIVVFSNDNEFSVKRFINDVQNKRIIFRPDSMDISFTDIVVSYEDAANLKIYGKVVVYIVQL